MKSPLNSLKVLDFSTLLPGPYASLMLADLGAEVLRIESFTRPDLVRSIPPVTSGISAAHAYLNRNKKSLALDLKKPEAINIIHQLLSDYDIVIEQFRPGVMQRLGLGYATLKQIKPDLIYCSITGYGQTGPLKDRAGHDINYLALSGVASYSARKDQAPVAMGVQVADVAGGSHHAVMGIMAAVIERAQTGEGQHIDVSMTDTAFAMNAMFGASALVSGTAPQAEAEMLNGGGFYDYYACADGRYLAVGSLEPQFLQKLCQATGLEELMAKAHHPKTLPEFKQALTDVLLSQSQGYWTELFSRLDACVEPVLDFTQACEHPQLVARNRIIEVKQGDQVISQLACPLKELSVDDEAGGAVGADNEKVLSALGYESNGIAVLLKEGVVGPSN